MPSLEMQAVCSGRAMVRQAHVGCTAVTTYPIGVVPPPHVPETPERTQEVLQARHEAFHEKVGRIVADCEWCPQIDTYETEEVAA